MLFNTGAAVLALATGFAAAKPVFSPSVNELPAYRRSAPVTPAPHRRESSNNPFSFIDGFNNFNNQQQVVNIKEENLQIIDNGRQQTVIQQAKQVIVVDQQNNGFNNDLNNLFRKSNARRQNNDKSTVMLVVQQIQVAVDDGRGNVLQQNVFAQSAVVANRGRRATETVMIFAQETLIAQNVLGNSIGQFGGVGGSSSQDPAAAAGQQAQNATSGVSAADAQAQAQAAAQAQAQAGQLPTQTNDVQLFGEKPTWSAIAEDPAATLGGIWQAELQDAQDASQNGADNQVNSDAAKVVAQALKQQQQQQQGGKGQ